MRATLTIAGLLHFSPTLFDGMLLPDGVDRDAVIFHIVEECGFLEIMYPNPDYLKQSINAWSIGMINGWNRFWKAIYKNYDPLNNYDRTEERNRNEKTGEKTGSKGEVVDSKTAFNDGNFAETDKSESEASGTRDENTDTTERNRIFGNIGVTSSQQLLEAELDITRKINFYKEIARDFKEKFCVLIY